MEAVSDALGIIFTESYISLAALLGMFLMTFGFASAGGVGASAAPPGSTAAKFAKDEDSISSRLALRLALAPPSQVPQNILVSYAQPHTERKLCGVLSVRRQVTHAFRIVALNLNFLCITVTAARAETVPPARLWDASW